MGCRGEGLEELLEELLEEAEEEMEEVAAASIRPAKA